MDEEIIEWQKEAAAVIHDIKNHVNKVEISESKSLTKFLSYLSMFSCTFLWYLNFAMFLILMV